jgi:hypothetical protein
MGNVGLLRDYTALYPRMRRLGGVVVSVFATGPKVCGSNPAEAMDLRALRICSTPFFGPEVKPEVPCLKILWHVEDPLTYQRYGMCKIIIPSSIPPIRSRCLSL